MGRRAASRGCAIRCSELRTAVLWERQLKLASLSSQARESWGEDGRESVCCGLSFHGRYVTHRRFRFFSTPLVSRAPVVFPGRAFSAIASFRSEPWADGAATV